MEKIGLHNYEAYFLDYIEGSLSHEEQHDLMQFLDEHPELKAELDTDFEEVTLIPDFNEAFDKDALRFEEAFTLSADNLDSVVVASVEGDLSKEEHEQLLDYLKDHKQEDLLKVYAATKLSADPKIAFDKSSLKVDEGIVLSSENVEEWMSASVDGTLSKQEQFMLQAFVEEHAMEKQLIAFQSTRLEADLSEVYPDKTGLKKRAGIIIPMYFRAAAAAAAVITLVVLVYTNDDNPISAGIGATDIETNESEGATPMHEYLEPKKNFAEFFKTPDKDRADNQMHQVSYESSDDLYVSDDIKEDQKEEKLIVPDDTPDRDPVDDKKKFEKPIEDENDNIVKMLPDTLPFIHTPKNLDDQDIHDDIAMVSSPINAIKSEQPYKMFTDMASNALNRDVKFSRDKNVETEEYVAYHFKLGRFEFQRKKGR